MVGWKWERRASSRVNEDEEKDKKKKSGWDIMEWDGTGWNRDKYIQKKLGKWRETNTGR